MSYKSGLPKNARDNGMSKKHPKDHSKVGKSAQKALVKRQKSRLNSYS